MGNLLVEKRDGRIVPFDLTRIVNAIFKAADATNEFGYDTAQVIAEEVMRSLQPQADNSAVHVEVIQNAIEQALMRKGFYQTAKAFILYREKRRQAREYSKLLDVTDLLGKYIGEETWEVHENANIGYSIQGLKAYITGKAEETYWLEKIYPEPIAKMHREGMVHIHNLSFLGSYCVGWDLEDLLRRGFGGVAGKTYSKPAKHLSSALGQMMNFLFTLQNETAGAVAFSSFDTLLAPFVRFDGLSYYQLKQELQEFVFNMNQTMRTGGQSPFSNITLDLTPHPLLKDRRVIYGGQELQNYTYGMFQKEMELIDLALFEVYAEGDGNGRPFTFPIPTINITPDFNWDNPVLDPVWESTAKYGIPYFANFINSDLSVEDARSMCCRLRLDTKELRSKGGGLFGASPLTGSIGVITINLPRIAYLSNTEEEFFSMLDHIMDKCRDGLEAKRKTLEKYTAMGLYPYSRIYLEPVYNATGQYWSNHFSTIGIVGMNEALMNLFGSDVNMGTEEGIAFAVKVLNFMRDKLVQYQEETGHMYNLEATPAESTSYSLALKDKELFPDIITSGTEDTPYYTNSTQLPVNYTDDPIELAQLQEPVQVLYTGGTVVHFFLGERISGEAAKNFVKLIFNNFRIPYITLTPTFSICPKHGYIAGEHEFCPLCDEELVKNGVNSSDAKPHIDIRLI